MQPGQVFMNPGAPGGGGGQKGPRPRDMVSPGMLGAIVAYKPHELTPAGAPGNTEGVGTSPPRDRMTVDLFVLVLPVNSATGQPQPIVFGGSPEYDRDPKPHDRMITGPAKFERVWLSASNIITALKPALAQNGMMVGRIERSTVGNLPFNLVSLADAQGNPTAELAQAAQIWGELSTGARQWTDVLNLQGGPYVPPQPAAGSVQYAAPAQAAAPTWQPPAPAQPVQYPPQPVAPPPTPAYPQPIPQAAAPVYGQPQAPWNPNAQGMVPPAAARPAEQYPNPALAGLQAGNWPQPAPPGPAPQAGPPAPDGWNPQAWAGLTAQQQAQVLGTLAPQS